MAIHKNLTGETATHPFAYKQSADPGAVGAGKGWIDTTSGPPYQLKVRNSGDTAWETVGSVTVAASETVAGIAEIATQGETDAGTDDARFLTAEKLAAYPRINPAGGTTGQVLKKDTGTNYDYSWQDDDTGTGGSPDLEGLSDVDLTSPAIRQGLFHDGTNFVNQMEPGQFVAPVGKTATFTASVAERSYNVDATSGNVTCNLPTAVGIAGKEFFVKKADGSVNTVTIEPNGSQTIDGVTNFVLDSENEGAVFESDGANWQITARPRASSTSSGHAGNVPSGGAADEVLTKDSGTDYDYSWQPATDTFDPLSTLRLADDFSQSGTSSDTVGELRWSVSGAITLRPGEAGHPGIVRSTTASSISSTSMIFLRTTSNPFIHPDDFFDMTVVLRPGQSDSTTDYKIGLFADSGPTYGIYLERLAADTNWFGVCKSNSGGNPQTRSDTSTAISAAWTRLRVRRTNSSTIAFSVDGGTEVTVATNVPTLTLNPFVWLKTTSAASKTLDIDLFYAKVAGLTR